MSSIPSLYDDWLRAALGAPAPDEPRSTCERCAMGTDPLLRESERFRPDLKCCTYLPQLPNFAVGRLLADDAPGLAEGRDRVRARIAKRLGATPLGLGPSPAWHDRYDRAHEGFGRDPALRCPYLSGDSERCTVWSHRAATCATWFCRKQRAIEGSRFWESTRDLLRAVETALSLRCAVDEGLDPDALDALVGDEGQVRSLARGELRAFTDADGALSEPDARRLWGRFYGHEERFYRACGERASSLSWSEVRATLGASGPLLERRAQRALAALADPTSPPVLRRAPLDVERMRDGRLRVASWYAASEPVLLDADLVDALDAFDGRPTEVVLSEVRARQGAAVDGATLRALVDRGVLVAPDGLDVPTEPTRDPVQPEDRLAIFRWFDDEAVTAGFEDDAAGRVAYVIRCGPQELRLDDPALYEFGRMLFARRNGFVARETSAWGPSVGWKRARTLLQRMLRDGLLQRLP